MSEKKCIFAPVKSKTPTKALDFYVKQFEHVAIAELETLTMTKICLPNCSHHRCGLLAYLRGPFPSLAIGLEPAPF